MHNSKPNELKISFSQTSRGISADNNKKTPKGLNNFELSKIVTQNGAAVNPNIETHNERVHSLSPPKKLLPEENYLIPLANKSNKKTLVLDLDETLVHSGFENFVCGSDIDIKVILIV
jgi:hypothetical protein